MNNELFASQAVKKGIHLDPRTKLLLLITISGFVLGGAGHGKLMTMYKLLLCLVPLILLIAAKMYKKAMLYIFIFAFSFICQSYLAIYINGLFKYIVVACCAIYLRFIPQIMMGYFLVSTTTVSEFTAAMKKLHISDKLIIPMSVIFRFFPTVIEEGKSINMAMKMRGIRLGGNNVISMLEYRLVPLMTCSINIGEELSEAALTRGLGGTVKRTNVCNIGFKIQDAIAILICVIIYGTYACQLIGIIKV